MKTWNRTISLIAGVALGAEAIGGCTTIEAHHDFSPSVDFDHAQNLANLAASARRSGAGEPADRESDRADGERSADGGVTVRRDPDKPTSSSASDWRHRQSSIDAYPATYRGPWHWPGGSHEAVAPAH
jgi:hypothetical protein